MEVLTEEKYIKCETLESFLKVKGLIQNIPVQYTFLISNSELHPGLCHLHSLIGQPESNEEYIHYRYSDMEAISLAPFNRNKTYTNDTLSFTYDRINGLFCIKSSSGSYKVHGNNYSYSLDNVSSGLIRDEYYMGLKGNRILINKKGNNELQSQIYQLKNRLDMPEDFINSFRSRLSFGFSSDPNYKIYLLNEEEVSGKYIVEFKITEISSNIIYVWNIMLDGGNEIIYPISIPIFGLVEVTIQTEKQMIKSKLANFTGKSYEQEVLKRELHGTSSIAYRFKKQIDFLNSMIKE
jgi:hypothetical protein